MRRSFVADERAQTGTGGWKLTAAVVVGTTIAMFGYEAVDALTGHGFEVVLVAVIGVAMGLTYRELNQQSGGLFG